jgi:hypothetical protein
MKAENMYFKAISVGDAVPHTDFDAAVHSVFRSAVNLRLDKGHRLLTLVASNEADLPQGIRVDTPADFSFEICRAGELVACRDDILRVGPLTIELRGTRRWKYDLPSLHADLTDPSAATAWRCAWDALNKRQIQLNAEIIAEDLFRSDGTIRTGVPRTAGKAMRGLVDATRRDDLLTAASSVRSLIGLGAGLTPSGDDLLVGYLAGLWCAVLDNSDISRAYLYHAARGQVSSRLADLAEAICRGENSERLLTIAESAMRVGHTSGMDAVTGMLIGLAVWSSPGTPYEAN